MTSKAIELNYEGENILIKRGERFLVVPSYKYTDDEVIDMVYATSS